MVIQVTTVGDVVDRTAAATPDSTALVMPGVRLTYSELAAEIDRVARCLSALGVGPGEKVGILMPNTLDFVTALIGSAKIGAVAVPINGRFKVHECRHVISHSEISVLLVASDPHGTDYSALIAEALPGSAGSDPLHLAVPDAPALRAVVDLGGHRPGFLDRRQFDEGGKQVPHALVEQRQQRVRVRDIAVLMYTSGTTARPKGCLLSHEALTRQAENVARTRFHLTAEDAVWNPLPLFHCGGIVPMLGCFTVGAKFCHAGFFTPGQALRTIEEERCTVLYPAFETIWFAVLTHADFDSTDLSAVRLVQNIATPEKLAQFEARMPWARQVSSYGSTESATNLTLPLPTDPYEVRINTLGKPIEGMEIKIVAPESGSELPAGTMGELCFRGYSSFDGYYKDPEQTAATIDSGQWFHTGDRAMIDDGGNLVYGGRIKDMLKVGGENVAAIEVEDFLARHSAVAIVQVVAAPDARYTEVPAAYVQLVPGAEVTEQELIDFCIGSIATYKIPRYVRFLTEWPMSGTKIQKFALRDRITSELAEAGITEAPRPTRAATT